MTLDRADFDAIKPAHDNGWPFDIESRVIAQTLIEIDTALGVWLDGGRASRERTQTVHADFLACLKCLHAVCLLFELFGRKDLDAVVGSQCEITTRTQARSKRRRKRQSTLDVELSFENAQKLLHCPSISSRTLPHVVRDPTYPHYAPPLPKSQTLFPTISRIFPRCAEKPRTLRANAQMVGTASSTQRANELWGIVEGGAPGAASSLIDKGLATRALWLRANTAGFCMSRACVALVATQRSTRPSTNARPRIITRVCGDLHRNDRSASSAIPSGEGRRRFGEACAADDEPATTN